MKTSKRISPKKKRGSEGVIVRGKALTAFESPERQNDWLVEDAFSVESSRLPDSVDLRDGMPRGWTRPNDQGTTGSCVGQAVSKAAHYHFLKIGKISRRRTQQRYSPSRRFLWQAPKEFDQWHLYPSTMLQLSGTYIKASLDVLRKHGCPEDRDFDMNDAGSMLPASQFYIRCRRFKIRSYRAVSPWVEGKVKFNEHGLKWWLANKGPVVTRFDVDEGFMRANKRTRLLEPNTKANPYGGHAALVIGYDERGNFLIMNSWGERWGNKGLVWVSPEWAKLKLSESYGLEI